MPTEPNLPDSVSVEFDPKQRVLQKIEFVCQRIVQGQAATNCWEIKYYRVHTGITVLLSVGGSAGLIKKQYDLTQLQAAQSLTM